MASLLARAYNPDVLSCIANLSNDEVFTPPELANRVLDMLPAELWSDSDVKILDPFCKSGVFLREAAKRFIKGLASIYPDLQERVDHIMHEQLYGIAVTELTSLLSRRSLYCSKYPNGIFSVSKFCDIEGRIRFRDVSHTWINGKCKYCGAAQSQYARSAELETHAYELIHTHHPERIFNMKFDVIVGNPPYQLSDGGAQASAKPVYQLFVQQAKKLNPSYLAMIIPARWYSGGKGLDEFRDEMLHDEHLKILNDFPITSDCFPGVNIRGGVCYFLWERGYSNNGEVEVITHNGTEQISHRRPLLYGDSGIFIRYAEALSILEKVQAKGETTLSSVVSSRKPFGIDAALLRGNAVRDDSKGMKSPVLCYKRGMKTAHIDLRDIPNHSDWVGSWKVFVPRANNIGTELADDNLNSFVGAPGTACTESYIAIGADMGLDESGARSLAKYLRTKFVRFLHSLAKVSQDATSKTYRFVPLPDFEKTLDDASLYERYGLSSREIAFVEETIAPMEEA